MTSGMEDEASSLQLQGQRADSTESTTSCRVSHQGPQREGLDSTLSFSFASTS